MASVKVAFGLGLAGLLKPIWLSEIWTKEKPVAAASAEPTSLEAGTPPTQRPDETGAGPGRAFERLPAVEGCVVIMFHYRLPKAGGAPVTSGDSAESGFIPGRRIFFARGFGNENRRSRRYAAAWIAIGKAAWTPTRKRRRCAFSPRSIKPRLANCHLLDATSGLGFGLLVWLVICRSRPASRSACMDYNPYNQPHAAANCWLQVRQRDDFAGYGIILIGWQ